MIYNCMCNLSQIFSSTHIYIYIYTRFLALQLRFRLRLQGLRSFNHLLLLTISSHCCCCDIFKLWYESCGMDAQDCCNGDNVRSSRTSNNNSSLSSKVGQKSGLERFQDDDEEEEKTTQRVYDGNIAFGWQNSSRIVRVSRASGGKDRHSKVWTSKGLRDRRVRLSVGTAIQFYDLQDRLGVDQPSKAVDWLIKVAADSIAELPPLNTSSFLDGDAAAVMEIQNGGNDQKQRKLVRACSSSTSETSKGSGLSLSRSEGRVKARERARERAAKEKENPGTRTSSSFTELLTGGINNSSSAQDSSSIFGLMGSPSLGQPQMPQQMEIPHFSLSGYHNHQHHHHHHQQQQHFSFMPETASESDYNNLSFTISSTSGLAAGFNNSRGTLQSNFLLPQHEHNLHRFGPLDEASNLPFLMTTTTSSVSSSMDNHQHHRQFPNGFDPRLHLHYDDGGRRSDHKGKGNG